MVRVGDTVRVLRHRNAFDEDVSKYCNWDIAIGATFVVGEIEPQEVSGYPCSIVFPENTDGGFWREDDLEVVSSSSPVRTVTRKEIVPGTYGRVRVMDEGAANMVTLWFEGHCFSSSDLRSAAATFTQLADALEDV